MNLKNFPFNQGFNRLGQLLQVMNQLKINRCCDHGPRLWIYVTLLGFKVTVVHGSNLLKAKLIVFIHNRSCIDEHARRLFGATGSDFADFFNGHVFHLKSSKLDYLFIDLKHQTSALFRTALLFNRFRFEIVLTFKELLSPNNNFLTQKAEK
jgi:hypothetical protein